MGLENRDRALWDEERESHQPEAKEAGYVQDEETGQEPCGPKEINKN